jgi:hypothetical protein
MKKKIVFLVAALALSKTLSAQMEIGVQTAYETPIDEMKWIFKPTQSFALTVMKTDKERRHRSAFGGSLGYARFTPKQDLFYYLVNDDELGTVHYSDYTIYRLAGNIRHDFILGKRIELSLGAELGYHYVKYSYQSDDAYISDGGTTIDSRVAAAPYGGVGLVLTKHISLSLQTRYLVTLSANGERKDDIVNVIWANSFGINFRFFE